MCGIPHLLMEVGGASKTTLLGGNVAARVRNSVCRPSASTQSWAIECYPLLAHGARVAEQLEEHALAEQYAQRFLQRGGHELCCSLTHALLGRTARRDRSAAIAQWRKAAAVAMDGRWYLYALRVGWQCGGVEGHAIAMAACEAMGRPMTDVLQELEAVGAAFEGGQAASAWAHRWAKEEAHSGAAASGPSTPQRK